MKIKSLLFIAACTILFSCSNKVPHSNHIPDNASVYGVINTPNIISKVAWDALLSGDLFDKLGKQGKSMESTMEDFHQSGVDIMENVYFFKSPELEEQDFAAILKLTDSKMLEDYLNKKGAEVSFVDGVSFGHIDEINYSFKNDVLLLIISEDNKGAQTYSQKVLNTDYSKTHNENMSTGLQMTHDLVYCMDVAAFMPQQLEAFNMSDEVFNADNIDGDMMYAYMNFESGKIHGNMAYLFGQNSSKEADKYNKDNQIEPLINTAAGEKVLASASLSFDFKMLLERMNERGLSENVDVMLSPYNTSMADITSLLSGDFLYLLSGIDSEEQVQTRMHFDPELLDYYQTEDTVTVNTISSTLLIGISKQERAQELLNQFSLFMMDKGGYYEVKLTGGIYVTLQEGALVLSNDESVLKGIVNKENLELNEKAKEIATKGPIHVWANMKEVSTGWKKIDPSNEKLMNIIYQNLSELTLDSDIDSEKVEYNINMMFEDQSKNSLLQIIELISENKKDLIAA